MQEQGPAGGYGRSMAQLSRVAGLLRDGQGPRIAVDTARTVRRRARTVRQVDDLTGRVRMLRMIADSALGRETDLPAASTALPITARAISPRPLWLRPRSRDRAAFEFLGGRHHLPPPELVDPPRHIAVFGANIGLVLAELGTLHPQARLLGVEPDAQNAALARRNVAHLGRRCRIVESAVWWRDEQLPVAWGRDAWGLDLRGAAPDQQPDTTHLSQAVDARRLIDDLTGGAELDYLLVNVESSWYEMLKHGDWTRDVRCLKIEIQAHYDEAVPMLRDLGYRARLERLRWGAFAVGIRP